MSVWANAEVGAWWSKNFGKASCLVQYVVIIMFLCLIIMETHKKAGTVSQNEVISFFQYIDFYGEKLPNKHKFRSPNITN